MQELSDLVVIANGKNRRNHSQHGDDAFKRYEHRTPAESGSKEKATTLGLTE